MRVLRHLCRHPRKWTVLETFRVFCIVVLCVLVLVTGVAYLLAQDQESNRVSKELTVSSTTRVPRKEASRKSYKFPVWDKAPTLVVFSKGVTSTFGGSEGHKHSMFTSFNVHKCGKNGDHRLSVYLYPFHRWEVDGVPFPPPSKMFLEIMDTIRKSKYWVDDPEDACILVPAIDILYLERDRVGAVQTVLGSLEFWGQEGQNHLLISFSVEDNPQLSHSRAIVASTGFSHQTFRPGFYIPLIAPNPLSLPKENTLTNRDNLDWLKKTEFIAIAAEPIPLDDDNIIVLDFCKGRATNYWERCRGRRVFAYPQILKMADFCVVWRDLSGPLLWDILSVGCIPVIIVDFQRLPFDDIIDWSRLAILMHEHELNSMNSILRGVTEQRQQKMKIQVRHIFNKYFESTKRMTEAILEILQDRVFSHQARTLEDWNRHPNIDNVESPIFNPASAPGESGFTAVVLAYERVTSLFKVITHISQVPSLSKIVVVWNNVHLPPPIASDWPKLNKTVKVVRMEANRMSNRFYPFEDIETEAVFSLDDDIVMLTVDEIEFAFQTWREFPERIVGFPSRSHVWDNVTGRWRYESEWKNEISMVLTGAAFYHKYWHYAFTHKMPKEIKDLVDSKMNCEDIAMNFLVAATTGQPPVKVTPRKKFKCPTCSNNEMLSSDSSHMMERSDCINHFSQIYKFMPLLSAEWRADPVLYKMDSMLPKLKKYRDIGSL